MGEVYRALDTRLERTVAIKILPQHLSWNPELRARFEREEKLISGLQHPNICTLHDIGSQDGIDFMVMEYVAGRTLNQIIPPEGLAPKVALKYALQVAEALASAHAAGVIHRDLKPSNIMVDEAGRIKVLDFGVSKIAATGSADSRAETITLATTTGEIVGTIAYMSPEQAEGKPISPSSDVFSFGSLFYEMLTGRRAFAGQSTAALLSAVLLDQPKSLNEPGKDFPPEIRRIVERCLRKEPSARYPSGMELAQELKDCRELLFPESGSLLTPKRIARTVRRPYVLLPLILLVVAAGLGIFWLVKHSREVRWARTVALPEITRLADAARFSEAYALATKADALIPEDPELQNAWKTIAYPISIVTTPPGASIYRKNYDEPNAPWVLVGISPLNEVRAPRGNFTWKFEKPGYGTVLRSTLGLFAFWTPTSLGAQQPRGTVVLDESGKIPPGMVRVTLANYSKELFIPGYDAKPQIALKDYWIDQYEVTNKQFKEFVDRGGYRKREYWKQEFRRDGGASTWEEAMVLFRDATGRPGPKDWSQGEYPKGQDDYPVTGVSWYEASAFAEFSGKSLPTIYHWNRAAGPMSAASIVPASNFGGPGVLAVGSKRGMSPWGNYDMAGNVKEWILNEAENGRRYVLGGAWDEPTYMFIDPDAQSPLLRASNIGFRCVKYDNSDSNLSAAAQPVLSPGRDFGQEKAAPDEMFRVYRGLYVYDKIPLNATVDHLDKADEEWKTEKITYTAGYGNERGILYLLLPKKGTPPFQTVLFFPGSNALSLRTFSLYSTAALDGILRSGRAVLYPVYKGTYERGDGMESDTANMSSTYRDHVIMWTKDVVRALDYAETRPELDHEKIAYYGYSWGAALGSIVPAVEPRIKICVLALGGLGFERSLPEVEEINFLSRVKQPVLMLNGRYDFYFPEQSSQDPFYQRLGTPKEQKKHIVYETGHNIPRNELIKETLNWLDLYFGPAN
jgi:eukaryotic-like serine/threonine-protein kinase